MDTYFKLKMFSDYIIPIALIVIVILVGTVVVTIASIKEKRIKNFFISNGYERELFDVASFGGGAFYGWTRKSDHARIDDRDIRGWSLREIKKKYK